MMDQKQDQFDGVCAVFSFIAAALILNQNQKDQKKLQQKLGLIVESIESIDLESIIQEHGRELLNAEILHPFENNSRIKFDEFWKRMREFLSESKNNIIILKLSGKYGQHVLVREVNDNRIKIIDSYEIASFNDVVFDQGEFKNFWPSVQFRKAVFLKKLAIFNQKTL